MENHVLVPISISLISVVLVSMYKKSTTDKFDQTEMVKLGALIAGVSACVLYYQEKLSARVLNEPFTMLKPN